MIVIFWVALSLIAAELLFVISFPLSFKLFRHIINMFYSSAEKKRSASMNYKLIGVLTGALSGCSSMFILLVIRSYDGLSSYWYIILSMVLIIWGLVMCMYEAAIAHSQGRFLERVGFPGNLIMPSLAFIENVQIKVLKSVFTAYLSDKKVIETDESKIQIYGMVKKYMFSFLGWSIPGIVVGCFLAYALVIL